MRQVKRIQIPWLWLIVLNCMTGVFASAHQLTVTILAKVWGPVVKLIVFANAAPFGSAFNLFIQRVYEESILRRLLVHSCVLTLPERLLFAQLQLMHLFSWDSAWEDRLLVSTEDELDAACLVRPVGSLINLSQIGCTLSLSEGYVLIKHRNSMRLSLWHWLACASWLLDQGIRTGLICLAKSKSILVTDIESRSIVLFSLGRRWKLEQTRAFNTRVHRVLSSFFCFSDRAELFCNFTRWLQQWPWNFREVESRHSEKLGVHQSAILNQSPCREFPCKARLGWESIWWSFWNLFLRFNFLFSFDLGCLFFAIDNRRLRQLCCTIYLHFVSNRELDWVAFGRGAALSLGLYRHPLGFFKCLNFLDLGWFATDGGPHWKRSVFFDKLKVFLKARPVGAECITSTGFEVTHRWLRFSAACTTV